MFFILLHPKYICDIMANFKTKALAAGLVIVAPAVFAQELPLNDASSRQNPAAVGSLPTEISAGLKVRPDVMDAFSGNFSMCSSESPIPFKMESTRETYGGGKGTNALNVDIGTKASDVALEIRVRAEKNYDSQSQQNGTALGIGAMTQRGRVRAFMQANAAKGAAKPSALAGADIMLGSNTTVSANLKVEKNARAQLSTGIDRNLNGSARCITITGSLGASGKNISRILAGMQVNTIHGRFGAFGGMERKDGKFKPVVGMTVALRI